MINRQEIEDVIDKSYNLESLRKLYRNYLYNFDDEGNLRLDLKDIDYSQQKVQKRELVRILTDIFISNEYFQKLLTYLPEDVKKVFYKLVWNGGKSRAEELERDLELKILLPNQGSTRGKSQDINSSYLFFCIDRVNNFNMSSYEYRLYLPDPVREVLKPNFEPPLEYNFLPIDEIDETEHLYENHSSVVKYLQLYYNYINSGNLNFSKQERPSKGSVKNVREYCEIKEFYESDDKDLEYLRTELIINFLKDISLDQQDNSVNIMKDLINEFISPQSSYNLDILLFHIKGKGDLRNTGDFKSRNTRVKNSIIQILKQCPSEKWLSVENIIKYIFYRNIYFELIDENFAENNLYFDEMKRASNSYAYGQKTYIKADNYNDLINIPLIKGLMFLFASFGIVDIAYNIPKSNLYKQKNQEYLTVFDGLKYARLTEFGAYILGLTEEFEVKIEKEEIEIKLDSERLLLTICGQDKFKILFIESFAEKIFEKRYKVTYSSFLNGCNTKEDLENKIKFFNAEISANPPKIWVDFFNEVLAKSNPLQKKSSYSIYKIAVNQELITLFTQDPILKNFVLKAEDFHILIENQHLPDIKKRLEEFGYLL